MVREAQTLQPTADIPSRREETTTLLRIGLPLTAAYVAEMGMFITDMKHWQQYARAHSEAFEQVRPASSIVEVTRLVDPRLMIEMEFEAVKVTGETTSVDV